MDFFLFCDVVNYSERVNIRISSKVYIMSFELI